MDAEESVALVTGALSGDARALTRLVEVLTPVIQARVARTLLCRSRRSANLREEVQDLTQEAFLALLVNEKRELRRWRPERGLSLENFVGLIAQRRTFDFMRSDRRNAWKEEPAPDEDLDLAVDQPDPRRIFISKEQLDLLLERLSEKLSPFGLLMFEVLFIADLSTEDVMAATGLSRAAVDAWRSRLRRLARKLSE